MIVGGVLIALASVVIPMAAIFLAIFLTPEPQQFQAPGETVVAVEKPGRFVLWHHENAMIDGRISHHSELPDGMQITFTDNSGTLLVAKPDRSTTVNGKGGTRRSVATVEVPVGGLLRIEVTGNSEPVVLSVTESMIGHFFTGFAIGGLACLITGIVGLVLFIKGIVTIFRTPSKPIPA